MDPVSSSVVVARPPAEVFAYLADVANHAEFTDHYLKDFRLTREDSLGLGAGARFRVDAPLNRFSWADVTVVEADAPRRIVQRGRTGKYNRVRLVSTYDLEPSGGSTRVTMTTETETPKLLSDKLMEAIARGWFKRKQGKAVKRLALILEEGRKRGPRATIAAGGPRKPASQFRL
ncbi:MAG: hypothetical protein AVDCRST_MAG85-406 [uncultured Solirubrobacteraceae bacterium]|uniref:Coenzyme Q-binding protein COQ10 START domain-containing protein n=1 Tax=uncultured Solirubrobacteraceae bacterium TaxID=1162706 RepID=A0A6J4RTL3_9ACTN|nr:MAG: hypothetical protein AVDCRST_MAG85-406 [uncultured Solirubrobacteraceae bacterium]